MAAPATPVTTQLGKAFYDLAVDIITLCSNLSIPVAGDAAQTGVISGSTASTIVSALETQRGLL